MDSDGSRYCYYDVGKVARDRRIQIQLHQLDDVILIMESLGRVA